MTTVTTPTIGQPMWGSDANGAFTYLDTTKASTGDLLALKALVISLQEQLYGLVVPQSLVYTYEWGTDEAGATGAMVPGHDVLSVNGIISYDPAANKHGTLGLRRTSGVHGTFTYANLSVAQSSGSIYGRVTSKLGTGDQVLLDFLDLNGVQGGALTLRSGGAFGLVDPSGANGETTVGVNWVANNWFRVDWQQTWDGTTQRVEFRIFGDPEGTSYESLATAWDSPADGWFPSRLRFIKANDSGAWGIDLDTYRTKNDISSWYQPYDPAPPGTVIHTFDEGTEGGAVPNNQNGVTLVGGNPVYKAVAAPPGHGAFGIEVPAATGGGTLTYNRVSEFQETGSIYLYIAAKGASSSKLVVFQNGTNRLVAINLSTQGKLQIQDSGGTSKNTASVALPTGGWSRVDWQVTWDNVSHDFQIDVRGFNTAESAGIADSSCSYLFTGAEGISLDPNTMQIGSTSNDWHFYLDTFRIIGNNDQWPDPYGTPVPPAKPTGEAGWTGDATQTTVEMTFYNDGRYTSVGAKWSLSPSMTSPTTISTGVTPDSMGFVKFSVTGLPTGTKIYYQATNSGTLVGSVRSFNTLKAVGTPCTTKIAVFSCKGDYDPTKPTYNNPVATDIVSFAPDRIMDLGDFGYPGNLSTDITTHKYNWALNVIDPARTAIQDIACVDYVISDHDVNGGETKAGNAPTFNDPVSAVNLLAWQACVPARMEDTQTPKRGRWRSEIEGRVMYLKVDTRSQDRTDTVTTPTDPRSSASTMLGATQLAWWKGRIDYAAAHGYLVVMFTDPAWNGTAPTSGGFIPVTYSDKWPSYIFERDLMSDYATSKGVNMFIAFGDSHGIQQDNGAHEKNGFAAICCGPFAQNLHVHFQDSYQMTYPTIGNPTGETVGIPDGGGPYRTAFMYQRLTIVDAGVGNGITITAVARDCTPFKSGGTPIYASGTPKTITGGTLVKTYAM